MEFIWNFDFQTSAKHIMSSLMSNNARCWRISNLFVHNDILRCNGLLLSKLLKFRLKRPFYKSLIPQWSITMQSLFLKDRSLTKIIYLFILLQLYISISYEVKKNLFRFFSLFWTLLKYVNIHWKPFNEIL